MHATLAPSFYKCQVALSLAKVDPSSAGTGGRKRAAAQVSGASVVIEVAWLYYREGLNQKEIAERLSLSRATVVNHLAEARTRGLIRIDLDPSAFAGHAAAVALTRRFGLAAAHVIPDEGQEEVGTFRRTVQGAAAWLPDLLRPGDRVGLAWGRTIYDLATTLEPTRLPDLTVLQLVGSMATPYGFSAEACSSLLAERLHATCANIHAPAVLSSDALAASLRAEPIIAAQLAGAEGCNKLLFSVGTCQTDSHVVRSGLATEDELAWYVARGAAAVLCGRFIDVAGRWVEGPIDARMIGVTPDYLIGLDMGICVTPGLDKVEATRAAIAGGYVTHLIAPLSVAQALLA